MADRYLYEIAEEIREEWPNVNYAARPYLDAMAALSGINDAYGCDDARGIVSYFLANARSWRGDAARRVKAELKGMLSAPRTRADIAGDILDSMLSAADDALAAAPVRPEPIRGADGALIGFVIPAGFFS